MLNLSTGSLLPAVLGAQYETSRETHLRKTNSRTSWSKGVGGSSKPFFNSALRWSSASFARVWAAIKAAR